MAPMGTVRPRGAACLLDARSREAVPPEERNPSSRFPETPHRCPPAAGRVAPPVGPTGLPHGGPPPRGPRALAPMFAACAAPLRTASAQCGRRHPVLPRRASGVDPPRVGSSQPSGCSPARVHRAHVRHLRTRLGRGRRHAVWRTDRSVQHASGVVPLPRAACCIDLIALILLHRSWRTDPAALRRLRRSPPFPIEPCGCVCPPFR